jgi:uncharacterized protein YukE
MMVDYGDKYERGKARLFDFHNIGDATRAFFAALDSLDSMQNERNALLREIDDALAVVHAPDSTNDGGRASVAEEMRNLLHNNEVYVSNWHEAEMRLSRNYFIYAKETSESATMLKQMRERIAELENKVAQADAVIRGQQGAELEDGTTVNCRSIADHQREIGNWKSYSIQLKEIIRIRDERIAVLARVLFDTITCDHCSFCEKHFGLASDAHDG